MEWKHTPVIVLSLILVGLLVGVGVLVQDKFADQTRDSLTLINESFTVPAINGTFTLDKGENVTGLTSIYNTNGSVFATTEYSIDLTTGVVTVTSNSTPCITASTDCVATYGYYEYYTESGTALRASRDAVGDVSNTWLSLIVTLIALTIIIGLVLRGFAFKGR